VKKGSAAKSKPITHGYCYNVKSASDYHWSDEAKVAKDTRDDTKSNFWLSREASKQTTSER